MEDQLKKIKPPLKTGEFTDFEFTEKMKMKILAEIHSRKKVKRRIIRERMIPVFLTILFATTFFLGMTKYVIYDHFLNPNAGKTANEEKITEASLPDFKLLFIHFQDKELEVFKDVNEADYKFESFNTKDEFYDQFRSLASRELIEKAFAKSLDERLDGLYLLPMEYPFHFESDLPTTTKKINDTKYQLFQKSYTDMYGEVTLTVTFEKMNQTWFITNIHPLH